MATVDRVRDEPTRTTFTVNRASSRVRPTVETAFEDDPLVDDVRTTGANDLHATVKDADSNPHAVGVDVDASGASATQVVVETNPNRVDDTPTAVSVHETITDEVRRSLATVGTDSLPPGLDDVGFLQRQATRTRLETDRSVDDVRRTLRAALDDCDAVAAWNDDGLDLYAESDAHRGNDGYRANVDVYEHDDGRTHVLVDSASKWFYGTYGGGSRYQGPLSARADAFHDHVLRAIVAELTDTPPEQVPATAWAPAPDTDPLAAIRDDFGDDELVDVDHDAANPERGDHSTRPTDAGAAGASTLPDPQEHEKQVADRRAIDTESPSGPNTRLLVTVLALVFFVALAAIGNMDLPVERKTQFATVALLGVTVAGFGVRKVR